MVAPIETQLHLEKFEENLFRSTEVLWRPRNARGVFGGVVIAQSLMAAVKTVDTRFQVHSMHCYFLTAVSIFLQLGWLWYLCLFVILVIIFSSSND